MAAVNSEKAIQFEFAGKLMTWKASCTGKRRRSASRHRHRDLRSKLASRSPTRFAMPTKRKRAAQDVLSARKRQTPAFVTPMAAVSVEALPEGPEWTYELKLDGYRALIIKDGASIRIRSRNDKDLMQMYPAGAAAGRRLQTEQAVIDGEIVAVDRQGRPSFQALQHRGTHPSHTIVFYAFDLLHLNGEDKRAMPLDERRADLARIIDKSGLLLSVVLPGSAADIVRTVRAMQLEGVIAKRRNSHYEAGERSANWQKLKLERQQEFVIGGYRPSGDSVDAPRRLFRRRGTTFCCQGSRGIEAACQTGTREKAKSSAIGSLPVRGPAD